MPPYELGGIFVHGKIVIGLGITFTKLLVDPGSIR